MKQEYIYTTGEVATICKVSARTVAKWFDSGRLKGYRLPESQDRRIPESDLLTFMKEFNIPIPPEIRRNELIPGTGIPKEGAFIFRMDGNQWCCVRPDFQNLQESHAGFGPTLYEAQQSLLDAEGAPSRKWRLWYLGSFADGNREGKRSTETVFRSLEEGIEFIEKATGIMGCKGEKAVKRGDWWVANNHGLQPIEGEVS